MYLCIKKYSSLKQNEIKIKKYENAFENYEFLTCISFIFCNLSVAADLRVKRQDDDEPEQNIEELCQDRPADEYFRLSSDGDCRDVVR